MFARLTQCAVVAFALFIGGPAKATALVYGTYYDESLSNSCFANFDCRINFSQTPADKLLMVSMISCVIGSTMPPAAIILEVSTTQNGPGLPRFFNLSFPAPRLIGSTDFTNLREDVRFLVGQGRFPFVIVQSPTSGNVSTMTCSLVGDLVTPIY